MRHLRIGLNKVLLSDKVLFASSTGRARLFDGIEMARIARGVGPIGSSAEPSVFTMINTNSPLKLDGPMAMGVIEMARHGQITCVTPFTLAGAMAPVTLAGALAEQNAEALAGLALDQLARPGAPFIYGGFTSNVDMKSGAPAFGTPEYMKAAIAGGQMARRYNLPYRTSNTCAANTVDAQAAYEVGVLAVGRDHGRRQSRHARVPAGWRAGWCGAYEKFALDCRFAADAGELPRAARHERPTRSGSMPFERWVQAGTSSGRATRSERYATAFYAPMYRTGGISSNGPPPAARLPSSKANAIWKRRWPNTRSRDRPGDPRGAGRLRRTPHPGGRREDDF